MTAPELLRLSAFGGNWTAYEEALYDVFHRDVIANDLRFRDQVVQARRKPEHEKKWASYWHLVSEGFVEDERLPDLRRCETVPRVRWIIENADSCAEIDVWQQVRVNKKNWMLWHQEYQIVVLEQRANYCLLKTSFCTERPHEIRKRSLERDSAERG